MRPITVEGGIGLVSKFIREALWGCTQHIEVEDVEVVLLNNRKGLFIIVYIEGCLVYLAEARPWMLAYILDIVEDQSLTTPNGSVVNDLDQIDVLKLLTED
jgi:hypothetical protein